MKPLIAITLAALLAGCGSMHMRSSGSSGAAPGAAASDATATGAAAPGISGPSHGMDFGRNVADRDRIFNMWVGG